MEIRTVFASPTNWRERIEAMKRADSEQGRYPRRVRQFRSEYYIADPVQKPHPTILVVGAFPLRGPPLRPFTADGCSHRRTGGQAERSSPMLPNFHAMLKEAGTRPAELSAVPLSPAPDDLDGLKRARDAGVRAGSMSLCRPRPRRGVADPG